MLALPEILYTSFLFVPANVLNDTALNERDLVSVNELYRLNSVLHVMPSAYLYI